MPLTTYALEGMMLVWDIEVTDQFIGWWDTLTVEEQESILLIGGDKRNRWRAFYAEMIPLADDLFDEHLTELETEGGI